MTDRFHSLTVALENDIRSDDAESLIAAIEHLRGVLSVSGNVSSPMDYVMKERVKSDVMAGLFKLAREA